MREQNRYLVSKPARNQSHASPLTFHVELQQVFFARREYCDRNSEDHFHA